ncbi:MAG: hypothetical protein Kow0029_30060 [Candidatus Rifleibacteriota bacterium]
MNYQFVNLDFLYFSLGLFFSLAFVDCRLLKNQLGDKGAWGYLSWFSGVLAVNFWFELINQFYFLGDGLAVLNMLANYLAWIFLLLFSLEFKDYTGEFSPFRGWWWFFTLAGASGILISQSAFATTQFCFLGLPAIIFLLRANSSGYVFKARQKCFCHQMAVFSIVAFSLGMALNMIAFTADKQFGLAACTLFSMLLSFSLWSCARNRSIENASEKLRASQRAFRIFLPVSLAIILPAGYLLASYFTNRASSNLFENKKSQAGNFELILERHFEETLSMVKAMCNSTELINALKKPDPKTLELANKILDSFSASLPGSVAYLMASNGLTVASSNRDSQTSFVGKDFSFRPYFKDAMAGKNGSLLALGTVSKVYGFYGSAPIFSENHKDVIGVGVIKITLEHLGKHFPTRPPIALVDENCHIVASNASETYWEKILPLDESNYNVCFQKTPQDCRASLSIMFKFADYKIKKALKESNLLILRYKMQKFGWSFVQIEKPDSIIYARLFGLTLTLLASILFMGVSAAWGINLENSEAIEKEAALYHSLVEGSPDVIAMIDIYGNFLKLNEQGCREFNLAGDEQIAFRIADLWEKESADKVMKAVQTAIDGQKAFCDATRRDAEGRISFWELSLSPIIDDGRKPKEIIVIMHDATAKRVAHQELKRERDLSSSILNTAQVIILLLDTDANVISVNQYFYELTGFAPDEIIGKNWLKNFLPENEFEKVSDYFRKNYRNFPSEPYENDIKTAHGGVITIEWRNKTLLDEFGDPLLVIAVGQDITGHIQTETTLRESKTKFAMLNNCFTRFGNSPDENISALTEVAWLISGADFAMILERVDNKLDPLTYSSIDPDFDLNKLKNCLEIEALEKFDKQPILIDNSSCESNFFCECLQMFNGLVGSAIFIDEAKEGVLLCGYEKKPETVSEEDLNLFGIIARSVEVEFARLREDRKLRSLLNELASRDKRMSLEMEIARTVHRSFLPNKAPEFPSFEFGFTFRPCFSVGGDYFDFIPVRNGKQLGVLFADISGHGVAGALLSSMLKVILSSVIQLEQEPAKILAAMNGKIEESFPAGYFVTAFFALLGENDNLVKVASAAPEPFLVIRKDGEVEVIGRGGQPMGLLPSEFVDDTSFDSHELKLAEGEKILFFTDGLTDVKIAQDERIGIDRLCKWAKEFSDMSPENLTDAIYKRAEELAIENGIDDDIMILAIAKK